MYRECDDGDDIIATVLNTICKIDEKKKKDNYFDITSSCMRAQTNTEKTSIVLKKKNKKLYTEYIKVITINYINTILRCVEIVLLRLFDLIWNAGNKQCVFSPYIRTRRVWIWRISIIFTADKNEQTTHRVPCLFNAIICSRRLQVYRFLWAHVQTHQPSAR